jgi:hypothetical protein
LAAEKLILKTLESKGGRATSAIAAASDAGRKEDSAAMALGRSPIVKSLGRSVHAIRGRTLSAEALARALRAGAD